MRVICLDFEGVILDGSATLKMLESIGHEFEEIKLIIRFLKSSSKPKRFRIVAKEIARSLKGMKAKDLERVGLMLKMTKGVRQALKVMRDRGEKVVIVSTNDKRFILDFFNSHGIDKYIDHVYAARLGVRNGRLTGKIYGDVIRNEKIGVVKKIERLFRVKKNKIIYIGDGLTDLPIMRRVGMAILFCPNTITKIEVFKDKALRRKHKDGELFLVDKKDLREVLRFI